MARKIRGKQVNWLLRPALYALPLLSQAIRTSERLATAMEARGFYGEVANRAHKRTYFRQTPLTRTSIVTGVAVLLGSFIAFFS